MKTLKSVTALLIMMMASMQVFAQGFYFDFGGGYAIATASQTIAANSTGTKIEIEKGTFGKGLNGGIAFGTMLNERVGIEMGISYLMGSKIKSEYGNSFGNESSQDASTRMLRFTPAIKIATGGEKINLYAKTGLVIGVAGTATVNETDMDSYFNGNQYVIETIEKTEKYSGGIAAGFTGALGMEVKTGSRSAFFAQLNFVAQSWAPSKSKITEYRSNGANVLPMLDISEIETEYESSLSESDFQNPGQPSKDLKFYLPMSSAGITIGMHFMLGAKKENK